MRVAAFSSFALLAILFCLYLASWRCNALPEEVVSALDNASSATLYSIQPAKEADTGVELITKKIQQYRDKTRYDAFLAQKRELTERQQLERSALSRRQTLETLTMQRRLRALELAWKGPRRTKPAGAAS